MTLDNQSMWIFRFLGCRNIMEDVTAYISWSFSYPLSILCRESKHTAKNIHTSFVLVFGNFPYRPYLNRPHPVALTTPTRVRIPSPRARTFWWVYKAGAKMQLCHSPPIPSGASVFRASLLWNLTMKLVTKLFFLASAIYHSIKIIDDISYSFYLFLSIFFYRKLLQILLLLDPNIS